MNCDRSQLILALEKILAAKNPEQKDSAFNQEKDAAFASFWAAVRQPSQETVLALMELLKSQNADVRSFGADAFGMIGGPAKRAATLLADLLNDDDVTVQGIAAAALRRVDPSSKVKVPWWARQSLLVPLSQAVYIGRLRAALAEPQIQ